MLKKTALFLRVGFPKQATHRRPGDEPFFYFGVGIAKTLLWPAE